MFARVTISMGSPDRAAEAVAFIADTLAPSIRNVPGLQHAYFLIDRTTGRGVALTVYDTEENLHASAATASRLRDETMQQLMGTIESVQEYEVVATV